MSCLKIIISGFLPVILLILGCSGPGISEEVKEDFILVHNRNGVRLGYSPESGISILRVGGRAYKDLNRNGELDDYENWQLPAEERARDLASRLSVEQIAGLMLYSSHQAIPTTLGWNVSTYKGLSYEESGALPNDLADRQVEFVKQDNLRHVLVTRVESPVIAARWNNNIQALVEGLGLGIPVNNSSDPRHESDAQAEYNAGSGGQISMWPGTLGLAASFDTELMRQFGEIASEEYRALGLATALSPQIDLATEPRWSRFSGTMGEDPDLATDMARAYVDGFQTSQGEAEISEGWGYKSVNAMVKHWPGGGPEEGGRDAHYGYGAYAVYPGRNLEDHLKPFTEGAFRLEGPTGTAAAVMPYYTISWNIDQKNSENVGNSYSRYIITDLLREKYGFEGVICTDWGITQDVSSVYEFKGKSWGVEELSVSERHYKAIKAGVDQFGGNDDMGPVLEAYKMGVKELGEPYMRKRFEASAVRLLLNMFRTGLFENPYLDAEESGRLVGKSEFMKAGYEAQLKSIIMLKNQNQVLPRKEKTRVYIPKRSLPEHTDWIGRRYEASEEYCMNPLIAGKYFTVTDDPAEADFALVQIESPDGGTGYSVDDLDKGGNGYVPISLQYEDYTAQSARPVSLAGGSPFEDFTNRSYKGKRVSTMNRNDWVLVETTKELMGEKPVIVVVHAHKPMVFSEVEPYAEAVLLHMGVQEQAILDIVSGKTEPSALLPFQLPADMATVEKQYEDVPGDMACYRDSEGNIYDFAFGMNWQGVIRDERVQRYK